MKIGVVFPQIEFGSDPVAIRDYAQTAEGLGFAHIVAYDHVLGANPDRPGELRTGRASDVRSLRHRRLPTARSGTRRESASGPVSFG